MHSERGVDVEKRTEHSFDLPRPQLEEVMTMKETIRWAVMAMAVGGFVAGCGSMTTARVPRVRSAVVTIFGKQNMASWYVALSPIPMRFYATYLGANATSPKVSIYTKGKLHCSWHFVLSTSSQTQLTYKQQAFNVTWPATVPQFFGFVKVDVSWFAQDHRHSGTVLFSVKPLNK